MLGRGEGAGLTFIQWAAAVLHNGLGHYAEALDWAARAGEDSDAQRFSGWALSELVEAAARADERNRGADAPRRMSRSTQATATDWGLGIEARARALLSDGETAERLYREAVERLGRTRQTSGYSWCGARSPRTRCPMRRCRSCSSRFPAGGTRCPGRSGKRWKRRAAWPRWHRTWRQARSLSDWQHLRCWLARRVLPQVELTMPSQ